MNAVGNPIHIITQNSIVSHNLLDEARFYEAFSTYKILSLELISIFCTSQVILLSL